MSLTCGRLAVLIEQLTCLSRFGSVQFGAVWFALRCRVVSIRGQIRHRNGEGVAVVWLVLCVVSLLLRTLVQATKPANHSTETNSQTHATGDPSMQRQPNDQPNGMQPKANKQTPMGTPIQNVRATSSDRQPASADGLSVPPNSMSVCLSVRTLSVRTLSVLELLFVRRNSSVTQLKIALRRRRHG